MCCTLVSGCMEKHFAPISKYQGKEYVRETTTSARISSLPVIGIALFFFNMSRIKAELNYMSGESADSKYGMEKKINEFLKFSITSNLMTVALLISGIAIGYLSLKTFLIAALPLLAWNIAAVQLIKKTPKEPVSETLT